MPIHVDDITVGQWLVITRSTGRIRSTIHGPVTVEPRCNGLPFKVESISLPFIAVRHVHGHADIIDTREHDFAAVNKSFVQHVIDQIEDHPEARPNRQRPLLRKIRRRQPPPDPNTCPRCGYTFIQRHNSTERRWELFCQECGNTKPL